MPSQARLPPVDACIPTTPFEAIVADYFQYMGYHYLVVADRLSGWVEVQQIKVGTNEAGAEGLCKSLRRMMVTFGVPVELSSDGGPEFTAGETTAFLKRWGIRHRLSSVCLPSSNGRAELAVKTAKRMLMDNVGPDGKLDNDAMVRALLTHRNTPDAGCKLSPAQVLLGRPLRDTLPMISKEVMVFNNEEILPQWRDAWNAKEEALKARYVKTLETLNEHSRDIPPLHHGDYVMIQNQSGRYPKKWDKSGMIVEIKGHDQYVVKTAGSGRLTLRNRRFLRPYTPHLTQSNMPTSVPYTEQVPTHVLPVEKPMQQMVQHPVSATPLDQNNNIPIVITTPSRPTVKYPAVQRSTDASSYPKLATPPVTTTPIRSVATTPTVHAEQISTGTTINPTPANPVGTPTQINVQTRYTRDSPLTPHRLSFGDLHDDFHTNSATSPADLVSKKRTSTRSQQQRKIYDAASGQYKLPTAVPDDA